MEFTNLEINILHPGMLTSVQDQGSTELLHMGVPLGGAMDREAAATANLLVGNDKNQPLLEMTLVGPKLEFGGKAAIAICGAETSPSIDGKGAESYKTLFVEAGQVLSFGRCRSGCRAYLAVGGNWISKSRKKGLPQAPLQKGHKIRIEARDFQNILQISPPTFSDFLELEVLKGPEFHLFRPAYLEHFLRHKWRIGPASNRMGYRLEGPQPYPDPGIREILSSGILPGCIQVSGSGQPVILLADAQSTGGYPRLALCKDHDLDALGQLKPGDGLCFWMKGQDH